MKIESRSLERRTGAVLIWILLALAVGVLLGWGGFSLWGGGGNGGNGKPPGKNDTDPPPPPPPPMPPIAKDLRVTQAGVEWNGRTIPFEEFQQVAKDIAVSSEDKRIRVIYAPDVDHLDEQHVQEVLRNAELKEIPSHESK